MSITNASVLKDPTISPTGGTAQAFNSLGKNLTVHNVFFDGTLYGNRVEAEFSAREPKPLASAPNGYTQQRRNVVVKSPLALDNGNATVNTIRIEMSNDIEMTAAERATLRQYAAQILFDSDFTEFWDSASTE